MARTMSRYETLYRNLLRVVGKLYGKMLIKEIRDGTELAIGEEWRGFRNGRGCTGESVYKTKVI